MTGTVLLLGEPVSITLKVDHKIRNRIVTDHGYSYPCEVIKCNGFSLDVLNSESCRVSIDDDHSVHFEFMGDLFEIKDEVNRG